MSRDEYAHREGKRNEAYREAYRSADFKAWVKSLTPEQRLHAEKLGLLAPRIDGASVQPGVEDLSPSQTPKTDGGIEGLIDGKTRLSVIYAALDDYHRRMLHSFICRKGRPVLQWASLSYLCGNGTCAKHARQLGMSKQAFHYHVRCVQKLLGLPPLGNQKSEAAREKYRLMNSRRKKVQD